MPNSPTSTGFPKKIWACVGVALIIAGVILALFDLTKIEIVVIGLVIFTVGMVVTTYALIGPPAGGFHTLLKADPKVNAEAWKTEAWLIVATLTVIVYVIILALWALKANPFWLMIFIGAIGGLIHEVVLSKGTVFFPKYKNNELYLGSIFGLIVGGIAGLLFTRSITLPITNELIVEAFLAGLAVKGVSQAVTMTKP